MTPIVSICTDVSTFIARLDSLTDLTESTKDKIRNVSGGGNVHYNNNTSVVCMTDTEGLQELLVPEIKITSYEEIFGSDTVAKIPEMRSLYDSIYVRGPEDDPFVGLPAGYDVSHLDLG